MKRLRLLLVGIAACVLTGPMVKGATPEKQPLVVVRGPTVVAFFGPVTEADLEKDPYLNDALSDFQTYAPRMRERLKKAGIEFHELYARSFRVKVGMTASLFRPVELDVGYYFVAPGKKPQVVYGIRTDDDILDMAKQYFGKPANKQ